MIRIQVFGDCLGCGGDGGFTNRINGNTVDCQACHGSGRVWRALTVEQALEVPQFRSAALSALEAQGLFVGEPACGLEFFDEVAA